MLIAGVAIIAVLAAVIPILLTTVSPGTAAGHGPTTRPSLGSTIPEHFLTIMVPGSAELSSVAFSPDGRLLAISAENPGATYLYNVATGKLAATLKVRRRGDILRATFSPDGKFLVSTSNNDQILLWNLATRKPITTFASPGAGTYPYGAAVSPDSKLLATGEVSNQSDVWDVATGRLIHVLKDATSILTVAFSPDGKLLAAGGGGPAFLWDAATGQRVTALYDPRSQGDDEVAFSPDGQLLAVADHNGSTYLWNVATHGLTATLPHTGSSGRFNTLAFSPDGKLLATANGDLWNVATRKLAGTINGPGGWDFASVAFSPDGRLVAAAVFNGPVFVRVVSQLIS